MLLPLYLHLFCTIFFIWECISAVNSGTTFLLGVFEHQRLAVCQGHDASIRAECSYESMGIFLQYVAWPNPLSIKGFEVSGVTSAENLETEVINHIS